MKDYLHDMFVSNSIRTSCATRKPIHNQQTPDVEYIELLAVTLGPGNSRYISVPFEIQNRGGLAKIFNCLMLTLPYVGRVNIYDPRALDRFSFSNALIPGGQLWVVFKSSSLSSVPKYSHQKLLRPKFSH